MKIQNRLALSITHRVLAMEFISEFIVIYPFYTIMFGQRGGVSAAGIGLLLAAWQVTTVLAEVPTGIIADKFSKKWVLLAAKLMKVLAFVSWLVAPSFAGYFVGFVLFGIGDALSSGAFQAYLYESLSEDGKSRFGALYARVNTMTTMSYTIAYLLSFAIGPKYNLLLVLSIAASFGAVLLARSLPAGSKIVKTHDKPRILASAMQHVFGSVALRELLVGAVAIACLVGVVVEFMPLYYTQSGAPTRVIPLLLVAGNLIGATLYWNMSKLEGFIERYRFALIVVALVLFVISFRGGVVTAVMGLLLLLRVIRLVQVHYESAMQHLSKDETRATVGSLYSFTARLLAVGFFMYIGFFAKHDVIIWPVRQIVVAAIILFMVSQVLLARKNARQKA